MSGQAALKKPATKSKQATVTTLDDAKNARIAKLREEAHAKANMSAKDVNLKGRLVSSILPEADRMNGGVRPEVMRQYNTATVADALVAAGRGQFTEKVNYKTGQLELAIIYVEADGTILPNGTMPSISELTGIVEAYAAENDIEPFGSK